MTIQARGCILKSTMVGISKPTHTTAHNKSTTGFTIVELLIVIVVIGILAAVTIVAYNGITAKARDTQMKADLAIVFKKMMIDKTLNDAYPSTLTAADSGKGIAPSNGGTFQYSVDNNVVPATFCITYVKDGVAFFIDQNNLITTGACPGHSLTGAPATAPSIGGYYNFTPSNPMTGLTLSTDIPTGAWMIIVLGFVNDADPVPSSGWTTLYPRYITGTLRTVVFGKIKSSTEPTTFSLTGSFGPASTNGVLLWGTGASSDLNSWVKGSTYVRGGTTATQATTTTPTVTTTTAQSLILSVSLERTTATETDVTSVSGATKWFFIPQPDTSKIQTIVVSTATLAAAGTSTPVVVTYPNTQVLNGTSFQIALPPT